MSHPLLEAAAAVLLGPLGACMRPFRNRNVVRVNLIAGSFPYRALSPATA